MLGSQALSPQEQTDFSHGMGECPDFSHDPPPEANNNLSEAKQMLLLYELLSLRHSVIATRSLSPLVTILLTKGPTCSLPAASCHCGGENLCQNPAPLPCGAGCTDLEPGPGLFTNCHLPAILRVPVCGIPMLSPHFPPQRRGWGLPWILSHIGISGCRKTTCIFSC